MESIPDGLKKKKTVDGKDMQGAGAYLHFLREYLDGRWFGEALGDFEEGIGNSANAVFFGFVFGQINDVQTL